MQVSRSEEPALRRAWVGLGYGIVLVGHGWMKWDIIAQQHWTLVLLLGVVFWGIPWYRDISRDNNNFLFLPVIILSAYSLIYVIALSDQLICWFLSFSIWLIWITWLRWFQRLLFFLRRQSCTWRSTSMGLVNRLWVGELLLLLMIRSDHQMITLLLFFCLIIF
jgi:hypothetical protein